MTAGELFRLLLQGGPGFCQIAVTNACNAGCRFCSFPRVAPAVRRAGITPVASVTLSRLITDLGEMLRCMEDLGFRRVTFSYPITRLHSSYLGFADHDSVDFTPGELYHWFSRVKALKSTTSLQILNPRLALSDLQRQLAGRPTRFPCLAGYKYWFVDWNLQVFSCHYPDEPLGPLEDLGRLLFRRHHCRACVIDCYRDPSVYQYLAVSVADALAALRRGQWLQGLGALLHPHNFLSLASLLEGRHWLRG
jgi:MoaA/NifB/PqqE/SkfB family radical SAM enzyme